MGGTDGVYEMYEPWRELVRGAEQDGIGKNPGTAWYGKRTSASRQGKKAKEGTE